MNKNAQPALSLGISAYVLGLLVGFYVILVAAWADMEATVYGFERLANAGLGGFHCPILMTATETSTISLKISNPTDKPITPSIRTQISTPTLLEESLENLRLAPGESTQLRWSVGPGNIDLRRFIFAKTLLYSSFPLPSQETTCGIFILNLPGTGKVILPFLIALSLAGLGWGLYQMNRLRVSYAWLRQRRGSLAFLALMVLLGLTLSFVGGWVLPLLLLVVTFLAIIILLGTLLTGKTR
jgi:hypothetical protein